MTAADRCQSCQVAPLSRARRHCRTEDRQVPCGWVRCECGAVVRPDGRFYLIPPSKEVRS